MLFVCLFFPTNAQTKVQVWVNFQNFRVLSKNSLIRRSLQNRHYSHWDNRFSSQQFQIRWKNTIQTASFGIAAPKLKAESKGKRGRCCLKKRRGKKKENFWVKPTFWVNMKLKLPINYFLHSLFQQQMNPRTLISPKCNKWMNTHSRSDDLPSCVVRLWIKPVNIEHELVSMLSCSLHALTAHLWCVPTQYMHCFYINLLVKTVRIVWNGACVGGKCVELWGWNTFHPESK